MTFSVSRSNVIVGFLFGSKSPALKLVLTGDGQPSAHFTANLKRTLERVANPETTASLALIKRDLALEELLSLTAALASMECDDLVKGAISQSTLPGPVFDEHRIELWIPITQPQFARRALSIVLGVLNKSISCEDTEIETYAEALSTQLAAKPPKPPEHSITNQPLLLQAAYDLGIPVFQLNEFHAVLGYGDQLRHFRSTLTDETSALGREVAQSKFRTAQYLRNLSLPVPAQFLPLNAEQAIAYAQRLGRPVVIKPDHLDRGVGVHTNLVEKEQVREAFNAVKSLSHRVVMEPHYSGFAHRLTVHRGKVIKVVRRTPGGVLGDGVHNVMELLERRARDKSVQEKAQRHSQYLTTLDPIASRMLLTQGLEPDYLPREGEFIRLRPTDNLSTGGHNSLLDIASDVHPENLSIALRAAEALKLDFAGIDILSDDLSLAWYENGAVIGEVNVVPQLGTGTTPEVYREVLESTLPNKGIIDIEVVIDNYANHAHAPDTSAGNGSGLSSIAGAWVGRKCIARSVSNSFTAARTLLLHSSAKSAICYMTREDVLTFGLPAVSCTKITVFAESESNKTLLEKALSPHTEQLTFLPPTV